MWGFIWNHEGTKKFRWKDVIQSPGKLRKVFRSDDSPFYAQFKKWEVEYLAEQERKKNAKK